MSLLKSFQAISLVSNHSKLSNNTINTAIRNVSSRSRRGLYDGKDIRSGNNVPFSLKKTKRKFRPNVFKKRIYSEILDEMIQFHATASALRSIDKMGGLDTYLLKSRHIIKGEGEGWQVKQRILQRIRNCKEKGIPIVEDIILSTEGKANISVEGSEA